MKRTGFIVAMIVFAILFLVSAGVILANYQKQRQTAAQFQELEELLLTESRIQDQGVTAAEKYAVLYEQNHDFIGWLHIDGTRIHYPVMQSQQQPDFYLTHSFDRTDSDSGVPYIAGNCEIDTADNLLIYGHNRKDGSMFADLCRYEQEDFYQSHKTIQFDTRQGFGEYTIIAVFKSTGSPLEQFRYYEFTQAQSPSDFDQYIAECQKKSLYDTGISAAYGDQLITLSTCEYSQIDGRMVVVAKRTAESYISVP